MTTINIKMPPGRLERLAEDGFKLPALSNAWISEHSSFEAPLFISGSAIYGSRLNSGAFSSVAGARFGNTSMGRYCSIAEQVAIGQHEHPVDWLTSSRISHVPDMHKWNQILSRDNPERMRFQRTPFASSNPVTVLGHDVWIGYGAYIRAGVKIGNGAVIAARAVVTKDVAPYSIVGGTPARLIRMRYPDSTIELLEQVRWWQYCLLDVRADLSNPHAAAETIAEAADAGRLKPYQGQVITAKQLAGMPL